MSTISGVSSSSDPWAAMKAQHAQRQAKMFAKVDANSDGGVDQAELKTMLSEVSRKTGVSIDGNVADTFTKMDSNTDGKLSSDELAKGLKSLMQPPPSTMDFAQARSADGPKGSKGSQDDLFAKIDTNGDGSIDKTESQVLTDKVKAETGKDTSDMFGKLDKDGDGKLTKAEFDAGKPKDGVQGAGGNKGPGGPDGPPPPGGPGGGGGGAGKTESSASTSTTYDPLDTNQDGTVSEMERLVGAIKDAVSASKSGSTDNDGDNDSSSATASKTSANTDTASDSANGAIAKLAKLIYAQIAAGFAGKTGSTFSASA
jgi:Ca2+-binding EF-hand superfamily protein